MLKDKFKDVKNDAKDFFNGFGQKGEQQMNYEEERPQGEQPEAMKHEAKPTPPVLKRSSQSFPESVTQNKEVINRNPRLRIYAPNSYHVVKNIGHDLDNKKMVMIDFTGVDTELREKILQFVYGMCFVLKIQPEDEIKNTIILDPLFEKRDK